MLIMELSIDSRKREKACYINRQFGVLKMRNGVGRQTIDQIAYAAMRHTSLIPIAIVQQLLVKERRVPTRGDSCMWTFLPANYMAERNVSVKVVSITL